MDFKSTWLRKRSSLLSQAWSKCSFRYTPLIHSSDGAAFKNSSRWTVLGWIRESSYCPRRLGSMLKSILALLTERAGFKSCLHHLLVMSPWEVAWPLWFQKIFKYKMGIITSQGWTENEVWQCISLGWKELYLFMDTSETEWEGRTWDGEGLRSRWTNVPKLGT